MLETIQQALTTMTWWEVVAVITALAYLLLAIAERIECWYAALMSTAIYTVLFWDVALLMESALQVYYMAMAVYGWWQWRNGSNSREKLKIQTWAIRTHVLVVMGLVVLVVVSGYLLSNNTEAAWPYLDSFTTWASVITTYMVAKKVLENWIYWLVIDSFSIFLYIDRGLYFTALLFMLYIVIVCFGFWQWRRRYYQQNDTSTA